MIDNLVSIIMPAYNASKTIEDSIKSVLNQTYSNWELIIIDDNSDDDTFDVVDKYLKDRRIIYLKTTTNMKAAKCRNIAIDIAKGRYIAFLDSDDLWYCDKLKIQLEFMQRKKCVFSYTSYNCIDENGNLLFRTIKANKNLNAYSLLKDTRVGCLTVMIDRKDISFKMITNNKREDMFSWYLLLKKGYKAYGIENTLATYRVSSSSSSANKLSAAKEYYKGLIDKDLANLSKFKAVAVFLSYAINAIIRRL